MSYDYRTGKSRIISSLDNSKNILEVSNLEKKPEKNGNFKTWLACIYIDILDSKDLFSNCENIQKMTCGAINSFIEESKIILEESPLLYKTKVCNDGIYALYSGSFKDNLYSLLDITFYLNTFIGMFNKILESKNLKSISAGIGFSCDQGIIIKNNNDSKFISSAITEAYSLAEIACKNKNFPINISELVYLNVEKIVDEKFPDFKKWVEKMFSSSNSISYYRCNIVKTDFDRWVESGLKDTD